MNVEVVQCRSTHVIIYNQIGQYYYSFFNWRSAAQSSSTTTVKPTVVQSKGGYFYFSIKHNALYTGVVS